jgi:hypothetical protein
MQTFVTEKSGSVCPIKLKGQSSNDKYYDK